jgi:GNAT superfamily N-acetyltransferase
MLWKVRPMAPTDAAEVSRLFDQLGYQVPAVQVERHAGEEGIDVLVVEEDGRVVGVVAAHTRWHLHRDGLVSSIDSLGVDREIRSRGVGAALVGAVCDNAKRAGARMVDLHSHQSRVDARRFYERHGFEVTSNYFIRQL